MERLQKREVERYGDQLITNQKIKTNSKLFLEWAEKYDDENFTGRSISVHRDWMEALSCEVVKLEADLSNDTR